MEDNITKNVTIAKFIGFDETMSVKTHCHSMAGEYRYHLTSTIFGPYVYKPEELKFHSDWNWLMFTLNHIQHIGHRFYMDINEEHTHVIISGMGIHYIPKYIVDIKLYKGLMETLFEAIYQFIKKYECYVEV